MRLGVGDAFVEQPGVQLVIGLEPQPRREETLAHQTDLVLDLTLLPARRRRAGHRIDQMMRAHLQEAAIVLPVLADEDRLHRRLHVVVDAARAGAPEEGEGALVRVEHHLLRLARIGADEHHPAVAQTHVRDLHGHRHAVHHHDLVAPVELVGLARRERQRHKGRPPSRSRAPGSRSGHSGEPRRSRPRSPAPAALRTAGSASDVRAPRLPAFSVSIRSRSRPSSAPARGRG